MKLMNKKILMLTDTVKMFLIQTCISKSAKRGQLYLHFWSVCYGGSFFLVKEDGKMFIEVMYQNWQANIAQVCQTACEAIVLFEYLYV